MNNQDHTILEKLRQLKQEPYDEMFETTDYHLLAEKVIRLLEEYEDG